MDAQTTSTAELARLNWRLGLAYAEAVKQTAKKHKLRLDLVGCHGQTLYHQARATNMRAGSLRARGRRARRRRSRQSWAFRWYRTSALPTCWSAARGSAGPASGLCALRRCKARARFAKHRRHRKLDSNSSKSSAARSAGIRYRAGKHGHRLAGAPAPLFSGKHNLFGA